MAHSLENRVPFLDNDLVDFSQKIPLRYKLKNFDNALRVNENQIGKKKHNNEGKKILRKAFSRYLPEKIINAKKQGFSAPDQSWFKGESIDFVKKTILDDSSKIYNYMDKKIVQKLVHEHLSGKKNRRLFIWSLINFDYNLKINKYN